MTSALRRFLFIRFFSALGDQLLLFIVPLLVYQATKNMALSGLAFFIEWLPRIISLPFAGVFSDRFGGRRVYFIADGMRALFCLVGFLLLCYWPHAVFGIISVLMGACAFFYAQAFIAQEATIPRLVAIDDLPKAQSAVQTIEQVTQVAGPFLGSLLSYKLPIVQLLWITACLFLTGFLGMWRLKNFSATVSKSTASRHVLAEIKMGWQVLNSHKKLINLCILTIILNLIWGIALATGAAMVTGTFHQPAAVYGFLQTGAGVVSIGSLMLTPILMQRTSLLTIGHGAYLFMILGGIFVGINHHFSLFVIGYLLIMAMDGVFNIYIRAERAKLIPSQHLGKTIGLIVLINQLSMPLSGLLVSAFAHHGNIGSLLIGVSLVAFACFLWQRVQEQNNIGKAHLRWYK